MHIAAIVLANIVNRPKADQIARVKLARGAVFHCSQLEPSATVTSKVPP
jgi:hypothetical protein